MKLLSLDLLHYGPFRSLSLDFSTKPRALHVILGSNATGKSTTLRAVLGLLFEIPKETGDAHTREEYPKLRVGALVADENGRSMKLIRRKGVKQTLLDPSEQPVDEAWLHSLLSGVTREQYEVMFGLSHDGLTKGGQALLEGGGDLAESLFAAGFGGTRVHAVLEKLEARADEIFTPRGKHKKKIVAALDDYKSAKSEAAKLSQPKKEYEQLEKELAERRARAATITKTLADLQAEERRLSRTAQALVPVAERERLLTALKEHEGAVILSEEAPEARRRAEATLVDTEPHEERLRGELAILSMQLDELPVPGALLAQSEAITVIRDGLGNHKTAVGKELPQLQGELRQVEDRTEALLSKLGRRTPLDGAGSLLVPQAVEKKIRALSKQRIGIGRDLEAAEHALSEARGKLRVENSKLSTLPSALDVTTLTRSYEIAQRDGDLDKALDDLRAEATATTSRIEAGLSTLGVARLSLEKLGALPLPAVETVEDFARHFIDHEAERKRLAKKAAEHQKRIAELKSELDALRRGGDVLTEADLDAARRERERSWSHVRHAWLGEPAADGAPDAPPPVQIAGQHEVSVQRVDTLSDRLRREADRIAKFEALSAERDRTASDIGDVMAEQSRLREAEERERERWNGAWAPAEIIPLSPAEMRGFLTRYQKLADAKTKLEDTRLREQALKERIKKHEEALATELTALSMIPDRMRGLVALAGQARAAIDQSRTTQLERETVEREVFRGENDVAHRTGVLEGQKRALETWTEQWSDAMHAIGLPKSTGTEEAEQELDVYANLAKHTESTRGFKRRISKIESDATQLTDQVEGLARLAAPELLGIPLEQAAAALLDRFTTGETNRRLKQEREKKLEEKQQDLLATREKRQAAERALTQLRAEARANDAPELIAAEERSRVVRKLRYDLESVELQLSRLGGGLRIEALVAECHGTDADAVARARQAIEEQIATADQERTRLNEEVGGLRKRLLDVDGSDRAAEEMARAEQHLSSISALVDDYARVKLAADLLKRAMEQYREKNQGPLVRRASELFARLTLGTFSGLRGEHDLQEDRPQLRCVPRRGDAIDVRALSDGTRDQLFLALRVASLEQYFLKSEPLPLILDDVLIQFDDARARAAIEVLGELSQQTQVLFFTHHTRLAELAEATLPEGILFRHDLDALAATAAAAVLTAS